MKWNEKRKHGYAFCSSFPSSFAFFNPQMLKSSIHRFCSQQKIYIRFPVFQKQFFSFLSLVKKSNRFCTICTITCNSTYSRKSMGFVLWVFIPDFLLTWIPISDIVWSSQKNEITETLSLITVIFFSQQRF